MKQYCRYCCCCSFGDVYYCGFYDKVLSESAVKRVNKCPEFVYCNLGDVDTGKQYQPRTKPKRMQQCEGQMEFDFKEEI